MRRDDIQEILGIGKTRFFALLKSYRQVPEISSISSQRKSSSKLSPEVEAAKDLTVSAIFWMKEYELLKHTFDVSIIARYLSEEITEPLLPALS
jgi:hypothetical protein